MLNSPTHFQSAITRLTQDLLVAFAKAGESLGLSKEQSEYLTLHTIRGSALLAETGTYTLQELIKMTASPGGTTEAGLKVLEKDVQKIVNDYLGVNDVK